METLAAGNPRQFTAGGPVESPIAVADGTAYAGSNPFRVCALKG